jgi:2'-5' RNA ligase
MAAVIELHPDEIEDHPSTPSHPAGKVTAFDEATGLPIVRRAVPSTESEVTHEHHSGGVNADSVANHQKGEECHAVQERSSAPVLQREPKGDRPEGGGRVQPVEQGNEVAGESAKPGGKKDVREEEVEHKYKHGNTQADILPDSDAGKALAELRKAIDPADLMGEGLIDDAHVTVRYGIEGDTAGIRAYLEKQTPFEATLGKTQEFPPSEHSDGAAPIIVPVESADLRRMEKEIEKHGTFAERSFPEYKPHATVAYVNPEAAKKYTGMDNANGKTFTVSCVSITDRDGNCEEVKFKSQDAPAKDSATGRDILHQSEDRGELVRHAKAHAQQFEDGLKAATRGITGAKFDAVRAEKEPDRLDEKIKDEGQPIHTIPDILAGRIGVDTRDAHDRTVAAVKSHFKVIRNEDEFEKGSPPTNYRVHKLQAQVTPQLSAEVHIVPREVLEANATQHGVYEDAREADLEGKDALAAKKEKQAKAINDAAMAKFNERNASEQAAKTEPAKLMKGVTVLLCGDKFGIVHGGNPNFSNGGRWSVETPDGTKTFKGSELTPVPHATPGDKPYVAFDLDRTLAVQRGAFKGDRFVGKPIPEMVERLKQHIKDGDDVRIFTARVSNDPKGIARAAIEAWLQRNIGQNLPISDRKDHLMKKFYDDRAVGVVPNTGKLVA